MTYPLCKVTSIITPGKYCVVSTNEDHVSEVLELEETMTTEILDCDSSDVEFCSQMCVAVKVTEGKFKRGIIEKKLSEDLYEVLLVDYGELIQLNKSNILMMKSDYMIVEPLAFIVRLHAVVPTRIVSSGEVSQIKALQEWSQDSMTFVKEALKDNPKVVVKSILFDQRTIYGDIYIPTEGQGGFISLRKLLVDNNYCVFSESRFLRSEGFSRSPEIVELDQKMEWVAKWQRENFGSQRSVGGPGPETSSDLSSLNSSGARSDSQHSDALEQPPDHESTSEVSFEVERGAGRGRGKIKNVIGHLSVNKTPSSGTSMDQKPTSVPNKSESQVQLGRGKLKKSCKPQNSITSSSDESQKPGTSSGTCSDNLGSQREASKIERAVVRPGEYSEFEDSHEPTEVSLSTDDEPPPLVRKSKLEDEQSESTVKKQDKLSVQISEQKPNSENTATTAKPKPVAPIPKFNLKVHKNWTEKIWERQVNQISLNCTWTPYVLFEDAAVQPANSFEELPIRTGIIKNLQRGGTFKFLSQVQRWGIPAIRKQLNTIIIGSSKTGKTLAYIIPVIDYIHDESYFEELPPGNGPSVVIVASSSRVCEAIYYLCYSLVGCHTANEHVRSDVKIVLAHGGGCEKEVWVSLTNGCDILISTPHCLVRLLETPILTNFERLTCLIFDEIDILSQNPFRKNVRIIMQKAEYSGKNRHCQKILCGEKWTPNVESLAKKFVSPYALIIGSYSEAVVFDGVKPIIYLVEQKEKLEILLKKIQELIGQSKILVAVEDIPDAVEVNNFLVANGIPTLVAHGDIMADLLRNRGITWKCLKDSALIATDTVLNELNVREVQTLIHYGLPSKSKTNFYLRYLTLESFRRDKQSFSKAKGNFTNKLQDIILIDEENHYQLPHIVDFVLRLKGKINTKILDKCNEIRRQIELLKWDYPICDTLLAFGGCRNWKSCPKRHAFVKSLDSPRGLPSSGWVNFIVLKVHHASLFSIRLVEHTDALGKTSKIEDRYMELCLKIAEFYKSEANQKPHPVPNVGDFCAVKTQVFQQDVFYRGKVMEYLTVDKYEKPLEVSVKLLDQGDVWQRKNVELYELPDSLAEYPPVAVDLRVSSVQPLDFDTSWSETANGFADRMMTRTMEKNQYWSGKIVLAVNNILFMEPIKRKLFLPHLNVHVFDMTVHDELLNNRIAVPNPDHLPPLLKLCLEEGLRVPKDEEMKKEDSAVIHPQWAFFDDDFVEVKFLAAENTSRVFLQPRKLEKVLEEVEEDCQKEGLKTLNEIKGNKRTAQGLGAGIFCLALFEDGKWNRGRIESETEKEYYVFFIDHGDFLHIAKPNVVPISQTLLLRLPCQAIECNLVGVQEKEECPMEVLQEIYAFSEDGKEYLHASVVRKDLVASITNGRKYSLNLTNKKGVSLNKMLVDSKMVCEEESEREHLKNLYLNEPEDEEEEDEDDEEETVEEEEEKEEMLEEVEEMLEKVEEKEEMKKEVEKKKENKSEMDKKEEKMNEEEDIQAVLPENFLSSFSDKVFEDEEAQEFLKEFAAKVFNIPPTEIEQKQKKEKPIPSTSASASSSASASTSAPASVSASASTSTPTTTKSKSSAKKQHRHEDKQKPHGCSSKGLELRSKKNVLTPQVQWCQNYVEIQMKILLGNVEDYHVVVGVHNIAFRCFLGEKFYAVDLRLYGAVNPQMTRVTIKPFHVLIVLRKLVFPLWPRLHADEGKLRWISLDVESLAEKEGVFTEKIRSVKQDIESGIIKKGVENEKIEPCSDSENSAEEVESESSSENED